MSRPSGEPVELRPKTDAELWQALKVDQAAALGALYDRHAPLVYGLARAILRNPHDAEDLTQEVFLALCDDCDYDAARGSLVGFLVTMTRSRAIDKLRGRSRRVRFLERWGDAAPADAAFPTPPEEVSLAKRSESVRNALAQLPQQQRQVLEMAYYRGLSQVEIATELNAPLGTVKTWARGGLFSLRSALQDLVE
ncbi:MAG: sigma-70 family RNA polymerase sigma factor [Gammaproteobacteria bacterium]